MKYIYSVFQLLHVAVLERSQKLCCAKSDNACRLNDVHWVFVLWVFEAEGKLKICSLIPSSPSLNVKASLGKILNPKFVLKSATEVCDSECECDPGEQVGALHSSLSHQSINMCVNG